MVAAHVAHGRQLWTTCRRRCTSELCSSRLWTVDPSTPESGLLVLPSACCAATPQRSDPSLNNQTCSLRAKPACCDFARLALRISQHRFARSKRTPRYRLCTIFGAPDPLGLMSQGIRAGIEPLRKEARLFGPALCQLLSSPAEEPTQASTDIAAPDCSPLASLVLCI